MNKKTNYKETKTMKKINIKNGVVALGIAALTISGASALTINTVTSGSSTTSSSGGTGQVNGTNTNSGANSNSSINANANINATVGHTSSSSDATSSGSSTSGGSVMTTGSNSIMISAPLNISSDADFQTYSNSIMTNDSNVSSITASGDNGIVVEYKHPGKFLGFIPVTVTATTEVTSNSDNTVNVKTKLPWWAMFVSGVQSFKSNIETRLQNSSDLQASMNARASAAGKARAVYQIVSGLNAEANANSTTNTSVNGSTNNQ
ncbi:MAG: hypothetical protein JWN37_653 [Candidatus Nomurabacteria bacterium]|nr:hypothetical protein [Candidatus Nomurabacteria bacterium]